VCSGVSVWQVRQLALVGAPHHACTSTPALAVAVWVTPLLDLGFRLPTLGPMQSVFCRASRRLVATHTRIIRGAAATVGKRRIALNRYPDVPSMGIE
jgi:hypothetical protein